MLTVLSTNQNAAMLPITYGGIHFIHVGVRCKYLLSATSFLIYERKESLCHTKNQLISIYEAGEINGLIKTSSKRMKVIVMSAVRKKVLIISLGFPFTS